MHSHLSVRGRAARMLGEPLRYRARPSSYESIVLGPDREPRVVHVLEWFTEDTAGRALHELIVPAEIMTAIGLDRLDGFDALLDALDAAGRPMSSCRKRDYPTKLDHEAAALGLPPGTSIYCESQLLLHDPDHTLALEMAYSAWVG